MKIIFKLLPYILLTIVVFFSYHQLLEMYFWRDDYTGLYIAQQKDLSLSPAYAFPYQWSLIIDKFAYDLFGLNATYHFLTMIILYIFISWLLFYFLKKLFSNLTAAFFCTLVFAAGFIGQDDMKMTQDGSNALIALIFLLISLVTLHLYHSGKKNLLICSLITFFLALEISPHRVSSSLLILLSLDWILSWYKRDFRLFLRNFWFISIFLIQTILHPSAYILGYEVRSAVGYSKTILNFSPLYILNSFGTFWNLIIPTPLQEQFNIYLGIQSKPSTLVKFWLSGLPAILLITTFVVYLKILRPSAYTLVITLKLLIMTVILSFFWARAIYLIDIDKGDLVAIFNGGMWLAFLLSWIYFGIPKFKLLSAFSLLAIFGILGTFFISIPERILVSYNRYLLLPSFVVSFLPIIFITKEFYQNDLTKKRISQSLFILIVLILVLPRIFFAYTSQREFKLVYSQHAKRMYRELQSFLPKVDKPTVIYIEGTTKQLQFAVGDAARVGYFGSEVAYAVHYQTQIENIILPQTLGEIPGLLNKNPKVSYQDIYTFIYDEEGLRDTSALTRQLLAGQIKPMVASGDSWIKDDKGIKLNPSSKILTLLPLKVKILMMLSAPVIEDGLVVSWKYNTFGLITENKSVKITPIIDNLWHEYEFTIPAGGEYLQELSINFPVDTPLKIGKTEFNY